MSTRNPAYARQTRLSMAPLARFAEQSGVGSDRKLAGRLGVDRHQIAAWRNNGIPWAAADRAAVALGTTVWNLWGEDWSRLCTERPAATRNTNYYVDAADFAEVDS